MSLESVFDEVQLSIPIHEGMNLYPGIEGLESPVEFKRIIKRDVRGFEVPQLIKNPLQGTYTETGRHIKESGFHPIDIFRKRGKLVGFSRNQIFDWYTAIVAHVKTCFSGKIGVNEVRRELELIKPGYAFIIDTLIKDNNHSPIGYTEWWLRETEGLIGVNDYNEKSPYFSQELIEEIMKRKAVLLGGGNPSFSRVGDGQSHNTDMLEIFYREGDNMILAPLVNIDMIKDDIVALKLCPENLHGFCPLNAYPVAYQGEFGKEILKRLDKCYEMLQEK